MIKVLDNRQLSYLLIAAFLLSGFSGLIYQSIWTHYLKLFLGHAAYAQALVLATFMGGLALGSWWAARLTASSRPLLVWYALAEAAVGLYALCFHQAFVQLVAFAFDSLLPGLESVAVAQLLKWGLALALILPPSILLGTTFPLMAEGLIRRQPELRGRLLGLLYFSNSLGAALGVLLSGFVLINLLGLNGTVLAAGAVNLLVAVIVIVAVKLSDTSETPLAPVLQSAAAGEAAGRVQRLLLACALGTGLASFIYELSWIRMLNMVLGSATHSFELMLASFILGLALGGWWIRGRIDGVANPLRRLAWIQLAMGLLAAATTVFYNQLFELMEFMMAGLAKTGQGYVLFKVSSMLLAMAVMLPATICAGMTLPLITATLSRHGYNERAVGHVYAINTLGAIFGVIITASLLIPTLGLRLSLLSGAALDIALAVALVAASAAGLSRRWPLGFAAAGVLGLGSIAAWSSFDIAKMSSSVYRSGQLTSESEGEEVLFHRAGRSATVGVIRDAQGGIRIATNGKTDAAIAPLDGLATADEHTMIFLAALGMALQPAAREAAVIGFGSGLTTHLLLGNPQLRQVDTIEIEPAMVEGARHFGSRVDRAYSDPRSKIHIEDARTFFSTQQRRYDIIVSEPSNPWVSGVAGLFTTEHYQRVKQYLNPQGVYVQWLQLYEFDVPLLGSVLQAFAENFSDYALYTGGSSDLLIVGVAQGELPVAGAAFASAPLLRADLERIGVFGEADIAARLIADKALLQPFLRASQIAANSDFRPYVDQNAERARFMTSRVDELLRLQRVTLLTDTSRQQHILEQHSWGRSTPVAVNAEQARALQVLFMNNLHLDRVGDISIPVLAYENAVSVSRLLYRCNPAMVEASWLGDAVWLSDISSVYGVPGLLTPFWTSLLDSSCFAQLPGQIQAAFRFFLAASERDDLAILREGSSIIDYNFDVPGFRNYRVLHMLAAYQRLDRPAAASLFMDRFNPGDKLGLEVLVLSAWLRSRAQPQD